MKNLAVSFVLSEALVFRSGGDRIYGQILLPNVAFGKGRPRRLCRGHLRLYWGRGREGLNGHELVEIEPTDSYEG